MKISIILLFYKKVKTILKRTLIFLLFITTSLFSQTDLSQKKIKLAGLKKEFIKTRVTVKDIEKSGLKHFEIIDPYTKEKAKYSGVPLDNFVKFFAKKDVSIITFIAIDGYKVVVNKKDWKKNLIVLSTQLNDEYVGYDKKGPLRLIYPNYNSLNENYTNNLPNWIWMIKLIEFK